MIFFSVSLFEKKLSNKDSLVIFEFLSKLSLTERENNCA